ncbi:MAG: DUF45 domain-containing protein [Clostridia bacterium]|nr:DUF45 domain-containing protein [Clostridia bacterium]
MEIKYELIRAKRKTVGIRVRDGEVTVRAPYGASAEDIERIVESHRAWIEKKLAQCEREKKKELTREEESVLFSLAEQYIPERVAYFSGITGLCPERVRISRAKRRFGSCSSSGSISVSCYAMLYPQEAVDLVIVHELCHLCHMDHSVRFYELLARILPDHKARKRLLSPENMLSVEETAAKYKEYSDNCKKTAEFSNKKVKE